MGNPLASDRDFFCFLNLPNPEGEYVNGNRVDDYQFYLFLEALARRDIPHVENFQRILVGGSITLAHWLERIVAEQARGFFNAHKFPYTGANKPRQVNCSFGLEIKPGIDFKYTLVANVINPLVPDLSASRDNTGTFQLFLNTTYAAAAFGGKQGTA